MPLVGVARLVNQKGAKIRDELSMAFSSRGGSRFHQDKLSRRSWFEAKRHGYWLVSGDKRDAGKAVTTKMGLRAVWNPGQGLQQQAGNALAPTPEPTDTTSQLSEQA